MVAEDSGVETGYTPTDGTWTAFLRGAAFELTVDARSTSAATALRMTLYYDKEGSRVVAATEDVTITSAMAEYTLSFASVTISECAGHRIGVEFANPSGASTWLGLDNVRLELVVKGSSGGALFPVPADEATDVPWEGTLAWEPGPQPNWIQYEFDRLCALDRLIVWNSNQELELMIGLGARNVTIEHSADGAAWTTLGDFELAQADGTETYAANTTIEFGAVAAKYVKLTVQNNWGGLSPQCSLSEVRFYAMPLAYENTTGTMTSETTRMFDDVQDWTKAGVTTLSLSFRGKVDNAASLPLWIRVADQNNKTVKVVFGDSGEDTTALADGAWHHVAGAYDGAQLKLYVDGVLVASNLHTGDIDSVTYDVNIGRDAQNTDRFYDGQIDDVRIYHGTLPKSEILKLANP